MALTLHIDTETWRKHLLDYVAAHPAVVPVVKGNGYGFGNSVLAAAATELGVSALAVGTYDEIALVESVFSGDLLVLSPWRPWIDAAPLHDPRVVHTVSRVDDLHELSSSGDRPRVVIEVLTSMRRHGIRVDGLPAIGPLLDGVGFEGWALHLPLAGDTVPEARSLAQRARATRPGPVWVSHVPPARVRELGVPDVRLRVGTALWLGVRGSLTARARVLDVHHLRRGERYGYRQRRARSEGHLVVAAGGTSHGIALEAPSAVTSMRQRAVALATGGLAAVGRSLSPYDIGGKQRWFAEPPHMQCSLLWLPSSVAPPAVGDSLDVDVRLTTTRFDKLVWN
jgi:alanine racemase